MVPSLALLCALAQAPASPYELPIGRPGTWLASPGRMTDLATYAPSTPDDVARAARGQRFVFLGESHATTPHQQMQAAIIDALARNGRKVIVGLEMLQRPKQPVLDQWLQGNLTEQDLLEKAEWKTQWGYDFSYYRPIFDVAQKHHIPILGLNVPRDWVRTAGRGGFASLPDEAKAQLPSDMPLTNQQHRTVFEALIGGHPNMSPTAFDNMYSAQVLWDEGMADTIARHMQANKPDSKTVYVVIAGSGHVMYRQGINYRLQRRGLGEGITVVMLSSSAPVRAANGIADYVYVSPAAEMEKSK
ncbi:MAG: ChaN family lipoprotein [Fimbriimonas sp.]